MDEREIFENLLDEIARYLAAIDVFRAQQREPSWLAEPAPCRTPPECVHRSAERVTAR